MVDVVRVALPAIIVMFDRQRIKSEHQILDLPQPLW